VRQAFLPVLSQARASSKAFAHSMASHVMPDPENKPANGDLVDSLWDHVLENPCGSSAEAKGHFRNFKKSCHPGFHK